MVAKNVINEMSSLLGGDTIRGAVKDVLGLSSTGAFVLVFFGAIFIILFMIWFVDFINVNIHCVADESAEVGLCNNETKKYQPSFMWKTDNDILRTIGTVTGLIGCGLFITCMVLSIISVYKTVKSFDD